MLLNRSANYDFSHVAAAHQEDSHKPDERKVRRHTTHISIPHLSAELILPSSLQRIEPNSLNNFAACHQFVSQDIRYMCADPASATSGAISISRRHPEDLVNPGGIIVKVSVPKDLFQVLPTIVSTPCLVLPLIFTQGINEKQSLAVAFGNTSSLKFQQSVNRRNLQRLQRYFAVYCAHALEAGVDTDMFNNVEYNLGLLSAAVATSKLNKKNFRVLMIAADLVRELGGARITSCKSAKDRTSMAVTHEEVSASDCGCFSYLLYYYLPI